MNKTTQSQTAKSEAIMAKIKNMIAETKAMKVEASKERFVTNSNGTKLLAGDRSIISERQKKIIMPEPGTTAANAVKAALAKLKA